MELRLYTFSGDRELVDKTAFMILRKDDNGTQNAWFSNFKLKKRCSITAPIILVNLEGNGVNCNYAYIDKFKRFYYIEDAVSLNNNIWELHLVVDVLMTYKDGIRNLVGFIERAETGKNGANITDISLIDNKRVVRQGYKSVTIDEFNIPSDYLFTYSVHDDPCYVLSGMGVKAE